MNAKQLAERAGELLNEVEFFGYKFEVRVDGQYGILIRAWYLDKDIYTGREDIQFTAWVSVSTQAGESRIVSAAFKVCLSSFEHRAREGFKYRGARIFGPHFDVNDLVKLCKDGKEDAGG